MASQFHDINRLRVADSNHFRTKERFRFQQTPLFGHYLHEYDDDAHHRKIMLYNVVK
jgi:hypothetical protein